MTATHRSVIFRLDLAIKDPMDIVDGRPRLHGEAHGASSNSDRILIIATVVISIAAVVTCWFGVRAAETEVLRYEAERSAHSAALFLRENLPHLPQILSGQEIQDADRKVIRSTSVASKIFRYKFFDKNDQPPWLKYI